MNMNEEEIREQERIQSEIERLEKQVDEISELIKSLKLLRKCRVCGKPVYARGYCVNCYNMVRRGKNPEEYVLVDKNGHRTLGKRTLRCKENWRKYMWERVHKGTECPLNEDELCEWTEEAMSVLADREFPVFSSVFENRNSIRITGDNLGINRGKVECLLEKGYKRILEKEQINH